MKAIRNLLGLWKAIAFLAAVIFFTACEKTAPTVETLSVQVKNQGTEVLVENKLVSEGSEAIIRKGTCLSTHALPSISDRVEISRASNSLYQATFSGLEKNSLYYVRAFAENNVGLSYGEVLEVNTTFKDPVKKALAETGRVENIRNTEATLYGSVDPLNSQASAWFELWIAEESPLIANIPILKEGRQEITLKVEGLTAGEVYSYRLAIENEAGKTFGETKEFRLFYELVYDYDGNEYWTVKIGDQIWTERNLETSHFLNGDPIPNVKPDNEWVSMTSPAWCYYNNDPALGITYGKLYNNYVGLDERGLIAGYRVPTVDEYRKLNTYLGGRLITPPKLKSNTDDWHEGGKGNNSSGFNALPAGARGNNDTFSSLFYSAVFQTTTIVNGTSLSSSVIISSDPTRTIMTSGVSPCYIGRSIRLIKK